ncbi:MAG: hypothetical protein MK194_14195 [Roseibacillus sp.]|nr:hypothetical protein [Roseibacillus sp.]
MNYQEEDKEDKKYKKGYGRKEFQKDVAEAVKPVVQETKTAKKKKKAPTRRSAYAKMSAAELRKFIREKKKALLIKSGFPEGGIPRSKAAMISLCMKLKRKRW